MLTMAELKSEHNFSLKSNKLDQINTYFEFSLSIRL